MIGGYLQARTRSERCANKMLRPFGDTNLIELALSKFAKPQNSFNFYFSAYDEKLKKIGRKYTSNIINRSKESEEGEEILLVFNYLSQLKEEYVMFINGCCPFLKLETMEKAAKFFLENNFKSLAAVVRSSEWYYHMDGTPINYIDTTVVDTKRTKPVFKIAQTFYIFPRERFLKNGFVWTNQPNDPYFYEINDLEAVDIDTELEFLMAESLYLKIKEQGSLK